MSSNNRDFFKTLYLFIVIIILDIALVYYLFLPGDGFRKINMIAVYSGINLGFIYLCFAEIKTIYQYIKQGRFKEGVKKILPYLKHRKTSHFARISGLIIGIFFIGWGIQADGGILIKLIAFIIGGFNIWRAI